MNRISREIAITEGMANSLQCTNSIDRRKFITEVEATRLFYSLILDYEYGKGNLQNVKPDVDSLIITNNLEGSLLVGYDINEFSLCAAIDYTAAFAMKIDFKIDFRLGKIIFTGEERYERNDEF
ncbi:hypothetical protein ACXZ1K_11205 [Pedobacter sp. PWIIR3]